MKKRLCALLIAVLCFTCLLPQGALAAPADSNNEEWEVLKQTNAERAKEGLAPLTAFASLQQATDLRAEELVELFSHTRPDGTDCFTVLNELNIPNSIAAENIAAGYQTPADVVTGWMNSEGHRANILHPNLNHLGVGYHLANGDTYGKYWVQLFVGGCTATALRIEGNMPKFDADGTLLTTDAAVAVDCNLHGTSYLPLVNADYTYNGDETVTVSYGGITETLPAKEGFSDVSDTAWYADEVAYVTSRSLMNGIGEGRFDPNGTMTRAMVVTVLHRMSGTPAPSGSAGFSDVKSGTWYTDAVNWAAESGIVLGVGENRFDPNGLITREQLVTMLYRYAEKTGADTSTLQNLSTFTDDDAVAAWSLTAMRWAVAKGVISGVPDGTRMKLAPQATASRAEAAAILMRYDQI